jgi:NADPH-dependent glutamate synthase beta subunit-like oxidoreductase/glutamate synthase domain-containing protein 3/NAD-dependent dihydropyrimidine dehydrogenase PreA subunit
MNENSHIISGVVNGERLQSRELEETLQTAVDQGHRRIAVQAMGQHGIGGRLWKAEDEAVQITITGPPGQRVGSMGFPNTRIEVMGPGSDDVGWLNAGAEIVIHGNAGNGVGNAMAQGKVYIDGNIGARGMTMTKQNPRFDPPELWVLGSVGDYFGEFMAGGIAVICGIEPQSDTNILGYRPLVGMVGGKVFFRGPHSGYSQNDAKLNPIEDADWDWLQANLETFLDRIGRKELLEKVTDPTHWQLLVARTPHERTGPKVPSMSEFRTKVWEQELGQGGLIGDLTDLDRSPIPLVPTGDLRRFVPVWENRKYKAPCEATCPTGIPVQQRWQLIRDGRIDEAVDMALSYTPFPASVCGYLCPNPCMQACTRQSAFMTPVDVSRLGQASIDAQLPEMPAESGHKIAVIGGGAAGISVAWQLRRFGHTGVVFDQAQHLGGKITSVIPNSRIPDDVVTKELERVEAVIPYVHLQQALTSEDIQQMREDYDFIVIAVGAQKPRTLNVPGNELLITAHDFLKAAKSDEIKPGGRIVIIGAGNVGCDVATEAYRLGSEEITLIDIQEPASFGKERQDAEAAGAQFRWPCFTKAITPQGVELTSGELIPADTVVISIGDAPDLRFLPAAVAVENGFIAVNEHQQTTDSRIFAIGDVVQPGLLTDAIGAGKRAAEAIAEMLAGRRPVSDTRQMIDTRRVTLEYFDPRVTAFSDADDCGSQCASCGSCRDCGICEAVCPQVAISRIQKAHDGYEYVVDAERCIGCGFCAGACPCGIWDLVDNFPMG